MVDRLGRVLTTVRTKRNGYAGTRLGTDIVISQHRTRNLLSGPRAATRSSWDVIDRLPIDAARDGRIDVVYEHRRGAGGHIVRVASLRRAGSSHGADHGIDVRFWRGGTGQHIDGWRW